MYPSYAEDGSTRKPRTPRCFTKLSSPNSKTCSSKRLQVMRADGAWRSGDITMWVLPSR